MKKLCLTYIAISFVALISIKFSYAGQLESHQIDSDSVYTEAYIHRVAGIQNSPARSLLDSLCQREEANNYANIPHHRLMWLSAFVESRQFRPNIAISILLGIYDSPELRSDSATHLKATSLLYNEYRVLNQMDEATKYSLIAIQESFELGDYNHWSMHKISYLEDRFAANNDPTTAEQMGAVISSMQQRSHQCTKDAIIWAMRTQADVYEKLNNYSAAISTHDQIMSIYQNLEPHDRVGLNLEKDADLAFNIGQAYAIQALLYAKSGQMANAEKKFALCQRYLEGLPPCLSSLLYTTIANYLVITKRYDQALNHLHRYEQAAQQSDSINVYLLDLKKLLSTIYYKIGDYKSAWQYQSDASIIADSLYARANFASANQMAAIYQTAQNETKILNQKITIAKFSSYLTTLLVGVIALALIIVIVLNNGRKIKRKNHILYNQIIKLNRIEEDETPIPSNGDKESELFNKANHYIKANKSYLDPNITREQIASAIGSNKTYLSAAIQQMCEQTFSEYVNSLRLEHAKQILFDDPAMKVEAIASMSGFNSARTFYRLFQNRYSLTPTQFRNISHSINHTK